eukprot:4684126-Alexandrium_andersonii.AAC.1
MHTFPGLDHSTKVALHAEHLRAVRIVAGTVAAEGASTHDRSDKQLLHQLGIVHVATRVQTLRL